MKNIVSDEHGKIAIITGASDGIGKAIAFLLKSLDYKLTLIGRSKKKLDAISESLSSSASSTLVIQVDLRNELEIHDAFLRSQEYWGKLDVLINSAGIGISTNFHSGPIKAWQEMWQINVLAMCICIKEALSYFDPISGGHIINISSTSGHRVPKNGQFYAATKFAVRALSESLRQELVRKNSPTKVSCISPGRTATNIFQDPETFVVNNDNKEMLDPKDIANAVAFLLKLDTHVSVQDIIMRSIKQIE